MAVLRRDRLSSLGLGLVGLAACTMAACTLVGCQSDYSYSAAKEIQGNATPDLDTLTQRHIDIDNQIAVTFDENGRMFNEDLGRFMLFDKPSMLSPAPIRH